jgi:hypothetical protein
MASELMTMNDVDHRELLDLRDQFLEMMRRTATPAVFDQDDKQRRPPRGWSGSDEGDNSLRCSPQSRASLHPKNPPIFRVCLPQ